MGTNLNIHQVFIMTRILVSFGLLVLVTVTEAASIKYRDSSYNGDYKENSYKDDHYKVDSYKDEYKDSYKKDDYYKEDSYKDDYKKDSYKDDYYKEDSYKKHEYK